MIDKVEPKFKAIAFPDNITIKEFIEFWKSNFTISLDVNSEDPKMQEWIYKHKDWFRDGAE